MNFINNFVQTVVGVPIGYALWLINMVVHNYGLAIIIVTVLVKTIAVPLAIQQQKSLIKTNALKPYIDEINSKYAKSRNIAKKNEEIQSLYAENNVNPLSGCLVMFFPLIIFLGMLDVVYRPLTHILHMSQGLIDRAAEILKSAGALKTAADSQIQIRLVSDVISNPARYESLGEGFVNSVKQIDLNFLGLNLGEVANLKSITVIVPIITLILSLLQIYVSFKSTTTMAVNQDKNGGKKPGGGGFKVAIYAMTIFGCWVSLTVPIGVSLYWNIGYIYQILQTLALNKFCKFEELQKKMVEEIESRRKKKKKKTVLQDGSKEKDSDRINNARKLLESVFEQ